MKSWETALSASTLLTTKSATGPNVSTPSSETLPMIRLSSKSLTTSLKFSKLCKHALAPNWTRWLNKSKHLTKLQVLTTWMMSIQNLTTKSIVWEMWDWDPLQALHKVMTKMDVRATSQEEAMAQVLEVAMKLNSTTRTWWSLTLTNNAWRLRWDSKTTTKR